MDHFWPACDHLRSIYDSISNSDNNPRYFDRRAGGSVRHGNALNMSHFSKKKKIDFSTAFENEFRGVSSRDVAPKAIIFTTYGKRSEIFENFSILRDF